jgi:hypothetical protein
VYRQVSILSQENKTSLRRVRDQRRVVAFVTPRPELWTVPVFSMARENPRSVLEPRGLLTEYEGSGLRPSPQPRALLPAGQGLRWRDPTANSQNARARAADDTAHRCER